MSAQRAEAVKNSRGSWRTARAITLGVLITVLGCSWCGYGQTPQAVVKAKMALATDAVHPGSTARAAVVAQIAPGYHINDHHPTLNYLIPTDLKFEPEKGFVVEKISYPKGKLQKFVFAENGLSVYQGRLIIPAAFQVSSGVASGASYTLRGQVSYQACNANSCFPPASAAFSLPIRVVAQRVPLKPANPQVFDQGAPK
jgi:DsbC/DsbD-like thiol-disulfide interchange protein